MDGRHLDGAGRLCRLPDGQHPAVLEWQGDQFFPAPSLPTNYPYRTGDLSAGLLLARGASAARPDLHVFRDRGPSGLFTTAPSQVNARRAAGIFHESYAMTEKYKIAIVGAASLRGKELSEVLTESAFATADFSLMDDESQLGQLEAVGDEVTFIQRIAPDAFVHEDFVFFTGSEEATRKHWPAGLKAGASLLDLTHAPEGEPGVLVRAPWVRDVLREGITASRPQAKADAPGLTPPATAP